MGRRSDSLKPGSMVEVTWLDSGADCTEKPGSADSALAIRTVYGKVLEIKSDPVAHGAMCKTASPCRCAVLHLAMDLPHDGDAGSIGVVWMESIVNVKRLRYE